MLKDNSTHFGKISILNHWVVAILMITALGLGLYMDNLPDGPDKWPILNFHKSVGVMILFLGTWRVIWRIKQGFPQHPEGVKPWEEKASAIAHYILLASIIILPISGYTYSETKGYGVSMFGLFSLPPLPDSERVSEIAHAIHAITGKLILLILFLHIGGALKHHFINKDRTLLRMFGK